MRYYRIRGGHRITGELDIGGAKNAALPILAALCLYEGEIEVHNCPHISDTVATAKILQDIGCRVAFQGTTLKVDTRGQLGYEIPDDIAKEMRSSILFMGAMLGRMGKVNIAAPGGCHIGERSIDLHLSGLEALGAEIYLDGGKFCCYAKELRGAKINLRFASVGATENLMLAAVRARGRTIIQNDAREPEIIDLAKFLNAMGAHITGAGTDIITIDGVEKLTKTAEPFSIMSDRIVAGTYLVAAAMTRGMITLRNVNPADLTPVIETLREMGCQIHAGKQCITLAAPRRLRAVRHLVTDIYPGFPTDMQAQFVAALTLGDGTSTVTETIFESRHAHALDLVRMGADINVSKDKRTFTIAGRERMHGADVTAHDLRGGAALVLAGLAAEGETIVRGVEYVERGYQSIDADLRLLGADVIVEG